MKIRMEVSADTYARLALGIENADARLQVSASELWPKRFPQKMGYKGHEHRDPSCCFVSITRGETVKGQPWNLEIDLEVKEKFSPAEVLGKGLVPDDVTEAQPCPREKVNAIFDILGVFPPVPKEAAKIDTSAIDSTIESIEKNVRTLIEPALGEESSRRLETCKATLTLCAVLKMYLKEAVSMEPGKEALKLPEIKYE